MKIVWLLEKALKAIVVTLEVGGNRKGTTTSEIKLTSIRALNIPVAIGCRKDLNYSRTARE